MLLTDVSLVLSSKLQSTNDSAAQLREAALRRGEARLAKSGALVVSTGRHTGRSPKDKFVLREATTEKSVWWANNQAISPDHFAALKSDFLAHAERREVFIQDLQAGADPDWRLDVRVVCERAWHALFIRHLLRRSGERAPAHFSPSLTIIDLPSFRADPARHGTNSETVIACDFANGLVLIGGTEYAGEIKKAVFTALNYALPAHGVLPMHCAANVGSRGDAAVFFGLSGTGKTTLSADPHRTLIGDDEHGWSPAGVYNFEGGCYAKIIRLSAEVEPQIYAATHRQDTVLENVVMNAAGEIDLDDASLTENTRAAYPLEFISNASLTGRADHPRSIVMLTADAFGVLPPIAKLNASQAIYHFLSGYTAKVAGTERGVSEPEATFSTCFGAPFLPRNPHVYANLLKGLIDRHQTKCWLVNTGWTGGAHGTGRRMPIAATRALLAAALDGRLDRTPMRVDPWFGIQVPVMVPQIETKILDPRATWVDVGAYDRQAKRLVGLFRKNFERFEVDAGAEVKAAAPAVAA